LNKGDEHERTGKHQQRLRLLLQRIRQVLRAGARGSRAFERREHVRFGQLSGREAGKAGRFRTGLRLRLTLAVFTSSAPGEGEGL